MEDTQDPATPPPAQPDVTIVKLGEAMQRIGVDQETGLTVPKSMEDQVALAAWAVKSGLLPDAIDSTPKAWMVMQRGTELGFPGLTAFEFLYPVNGRVRLTPDGAKAKALACGLLEDFSEETFGEGDTLMARVTVRRRGIPTAIIAEFSVLDAKLAGLHNKDNWKKHPKRMCKARARGFAFADAFRDVIGGLQVREPFDLDPGEAVTTVKPTERRAAMPAPATPDPFLDELGAVQQQAETAVALATVPPTWVPATAPIATEGGGMLPEEIAYKTAPGCNHSSFPRPVPKGKVQVCTDCGEEVRGPHPPELA